MASKGSRNPHFVKRIPADLRSRMVGRTLVIPFADGTVTFNVTSSTQSIRFSLRTSNPVEAKVRQAEALAYVEQYLEAVRSSRPLQLTHRQITALAGEFYKSWASGPDTTGSLTLTPSTGEFSTRDDDGLDEAEMLAAAAASLREKAEGADESYFLKAHGPDIDHILAKLGIPEVTEATRGKLAVSFGKALLEGIQTNSRVAGGDYSPDENLLRFPKWEPPEQPNKPQSKSGSKVFLTGLVEGWWQEARAAGKSESTHESYANTFRLFSTFLGHDDALRVTPQDVVNYKDHRLSAINPRTKKPVSAKTVKASDLTALKSVFDWAVVNLKVPSNPAKGVTLKLGKKVKVRERDFTDAEASAILRGANSLAHTKLRNQTELAKRWVPWLCAYSGCRLGELVQLRKEDFRQQGGSWLMHITPEAGTVKGKEFREVPVHKHLIEMGLLDFVAAAKPGYLFMTIKPGNTFRGVWQSKKNRLAEFAREFVKDPNVAPNHGWRHTFKTRGRGAGIENVTLDAICGHAPETTGESYGTVPLKAKVSAMAIFPRYSTGQISN
ncbi:MULTISPECIES: DUF6538 domain-containing protein [unclassified Sinorhizobium]|uniref:DUF6538 domain-containing protein n=1 Tax=unclassified Sinorhizobium TaxID=2613772 RepID=UPI003524C813